MATTRNETMTRGCKNTARRGARHPGINIFVWPGTFHHPLRMTKSSRMKQHILRAP